MDDGPRDLALYQCYTYTPDKQRNDELKLFIITDFLNPCGADVLEEKT